VRATISARGRGRRRWADARALGFPVIDVQVTLTDGSYHSVDSSDLAFRTAARVGMSEALPQCQPVLLEPIHLVEIVCPTRPPRRSTPFCRPARPDPRLRHPRGLARMGLRPRHHAEAEIGD